MTGSCHVRWLILASTVPMGQQAMERRLMAAIASGAAPGWTFEETVVAPLRSPARVGLRLPARSPGFVTRLAGRLVARGAALVHRFDLRIPAQVPGEVLTVHDLPPLRFPDEGRLPAHAFGSARRAACVVCPSEFAAAEVRDLLGVRNTRVVPNGVDELFVEGPPASPEELSAYGITGPFVLHAAGATERKNLGALAGAWRDVAAEEPSVQLVLCGPPDERRTSLFAGFRGAVMPGRMEPAQVARLMRAAACVVVPSIYEGFGLPVLEAQAAGTPVVASERGALREVSGGHALLVEPDAASLADGILRALRRDAGVDGMVRSAAAWARGFTWERAAEAYLAVYAEVLS